ncbi:MAG TPA: EthD family reductase [Thermoanaerobaculia bacterium]|nr:EthD family reductase [Thermoanaerobaculia bacterium]
MVKVVAFFKRKPGTSVEAFDRHWRTRHAELVRRLPGLRRYVQNPTLESGYRKREPVYDGVAEAWFDDGDALRVSGASAEYRAVKADEAAFLDAASLGSLLTEEVVVVEGPAPPDGVKLVAFLNRRPDLEPGAFRAYWRDRHGPLAAAVPGLRRYVQCHVAPGIYLAGREPVYDGVPISWFDDADALRASGSSPEYEAVRRDEASFLVSRALPFVIVSAREIAI